MSDCVKNTWDTVDGGTGGASVYRLTEACAALFDCAAGSYCPAGTFEGTMEEATAYFAFAWRNEGKCEVVAGHDDGVWAYQCACGNGFWCDANTALPKFCPKGYVCETPDAIVRCPEDHYCKEGSAVAFRCTPGQRCPEGSATPEVSVSGLFLFVVITVVSYGAFKLRERYRATAMRKGNQELEDYHVVMDDREARASEATNALQTEAVELPEVRGGDEKDTTEPAVPKDEAYLIEFEDVRLVLPDGTTIMRGPSGKFAPGTSTAIMGASGAGKTTIMNLVTGKVAKTSGVIRVNGEECASLAKWRSRVAFVPQEDVMHRQLTVLENLTFSASARLPATWPEARKRELVMKVLYVLNLVKIQHSKIGDEFERGVSGGQRKRVNVGLELVADPKVLFLDEPTSGLDSVSATELACMLRAVAEADALTVAAVIHSPGPAAFDAFHRFLLLQTGGRLVYHGETRGVEAYFARIGFKYPRGETLDPVADFIMKCVAGAVEPSDDAALRLPDGAAWDHLTGFTELWALANDLPPPPGDDATSTKSTRRDRALAHLVTVLREDLVDFPLECARAFCPSRGDPDRPTISTGATFVLCLRRACRQAYASFGTFFLGVVVFYFAVGQFLTNLIGDDLNVLGGYPADICLQQYPELQGACLNLQRNDFMPAISSIIFIVVAMGAATAASTFGCETSQYWREAASGLNTPAYFFAKVVSDVPICVLSAIAIWAAFISGFDSPMENGPFLVSLVLINVFGYFSGYFLSFLLPYTACGLAAVAWSVFWSNMFSGAKQLISDASAQRRWIFDVSAPRWFMEAIFYATTVEPYEQVREGPAKGEDYFDLSRQKKTYRYQDDFWVCMRWLCLVNAALLLVDLVLITVTKLEKKR